MARPNFVEKTFAGGSKRKIRESFLPQKFSTIIRYVTLDLNIWHACLLAQAEGSSLFELFETTITTVNSQAFS